MHTMAWWSHARSHYMSSCNYRHKGSLAHNQLTHWGRVTHICVGNLTIIGSDNGLSPGQRQAIIWNNARILLIGPLGTNFNDISIEIHTFSFKKMHFKMSSAKWRPFCHGLNVLNIIFNLHKLHKRTYYTLTCKLCIHMHFCNTEKKCPISIPLCRISWKVNNNWWYDIPMRT